MDTNLFWTWVFVGLSFTLYIGIAIWSRASTTEEFYVAGHHVPPLANGMATAADWMSAASFLSMAGLIAFGGYDGSVYLMGWTGGYVLLALLLAPYLRKFGKFTVPDFVGDRYYSDAARLVAVVCAIFVSFTYIAGQMRGVGIVFSRFLEIPIDYGVVVGMVIVFAYAVLGGMRGITYTQVAQYVILIFAYLTPAIFVSMLITGNPVPQLGFISNVQGEPIAMLDKLNGVLTDLGFKEYTSGSKAMFDIFCITMALMVGTAGLPHVIIRFFTVPKVSDARKSAGWALIFIAILYTTAPAVAAFARLNFAESVSESVYAPTAEQTAAGVKATPDWVKTWEKNTGLIKVEDKNADGIVTYHADPARNEITPDKDIMVLANPEIAGLPGWVVGLVAAGALAAALSTAAGLLLVISSAVSHDLLKRTLWKNMSDKTELTVARAAAGGAVIIAGYFGINPPDYVAAVVAFAFSLAAASFFPTIFMGIFWKRMNKEGAISGMVTGLVFTLLYIVYFKFGLPGLGKGVESQWLFGVSPEGIGTIGMALNFAIAAAVSAVTRAPPAEVQNMVDEIRIPSTRRHVADALPAAE
ncbi:MAG TPA: cation acetate symporter [Hyphomonadaceae bacterium]|nr:cation acetate symporter [Hyphomonadaceae bacterium]